MNEHAGTWVQGAWYSNDGYLPYGERYAYAYTYDRKLWWKDADEGVDVDAMHSTSRGYPWEHGEDLDLCDICNSIIASGDHYLGRCSACLSCLDCLEHVRECQCWSPEKARAKVLDSRGSPVVMGPPGDTAPDAGTR